MFTLFAEEKPHFGRLSSLPFGGRIFCNLRHTNNCCFRKDTLE
jgi:hypothetical protein